MEKLRAGREGVAQDDSVIGTAGAKNAMETADRMAEIPNSMHHAPRRYFVGESGYQFQLTLH
jgi:hypothetical protein